MPMVKGRGVSVFRRSTDGLWAGSIYLGGGRKRWVYGHDEADVRAKLAALGFDPPPPRPQTRLNYRAMDASVATRVVARGRRLGWSDEYLGQVLAASLLRARVLKDVVGPCVYCGSELADTVDHVTPLSRRADATTELVSACRACNQSKGMRTPAEWKGADIF